MPEGLSTSSTPSVAVVLTGRAVGWRRILQLREERLDSRRTLDAVVRFEHDLGSQTEPQGAADARAKVTGDAVEAVARCRALGLGSVNAHEHGGDAQIAGDIDARHGDETD